MGDRSSTIDISRKLGGAVPLFGEGEQRPHRTQYGLGWGLPPWQVSSWSIQPFDHNRHGPKLGVVVPPFRGQGAGSPVNTMSSGPRPTSVPSGILIHPAVWPQLTWAKIGGLCPFLVGGVGPHLTQCGLGRRLPPCQVSSSSIRLATIHQHYWQTDRTDRQRSDSIGKPFYKRSLKNGTNEQQCATIIWWIKIVMTVQLSFHCTN